MSRAQQKAIVLARARGRSFVKDPEGSEIELRVFRDKFERELSARSDEYGAVRSMGGAIARSKAWARGGK